MSIYFGVEPFEPANMMYVGISEELITNQVLDACDYIRENYGMRVPRVIIDEILNEFDINYSLLDRYQQDLIDQFDVY